MIPPYGRKWRTKEPLDESERGEWKSWLKTQHSKTNIMASGPITSWQRDGETIETIRDFLFLGSKITADGDCSHEIKRHLLLGRKAMTNLDSVLKSRDVTLLTKVYLVKAMVFPVVMYGCKSWTIKKAECLRKMLLNCGVGEDSWESLGLQEDPTSPSKRRSVLGVLWNSAFRCLYLSFSSLLFASLLFAAICKASPDGHFAFLHFFSMGMVLIPVSCMDVRVELWRNLSAEELMLLNCGVGEDSWESHGLQGDPTSPFWRRSALGFLWKEWC